MDTENSGSLPALSTKQMPPLPSLSAPFCLSEACWLARQTRAGVVLGDGNQFLKGHFLCCGQDLYCSQCLGCRVQKGAFQG